MARISSIKSKYTPITLTIILIVTIGIVFKSLVFGREPILGLIFLVLSLGLFLWLIDQVFLVADMVEFDGHKVKITHRKKVYTIEVGDIESLSAGFPNGSGITLNSNVKGCPRSLRFYAQTRAFGIGYSKDFKEFLKKAGGFS